MTFLEHIYAVKNLLDRGPSSQSFRFTDRLIAHYLKASRSLLLKRKLDKEKMISENNAQRFCLRVEEKDFADCPQCNVPEFNCGLYRGVLQLPNSIRTRWGHTYTIRDIMGNIISPFHLTNNKYKEFSLTQNENNFGWFISNQYPYIIAEKNPGVIIIEGVFEDTEEVSNLPVCGEGDTGACIDFYETTRFALDPELVFPMYEMTLQFLGVGLQSTEDRLLNAADPKIQNVIE